MSFSHLNKVEHAKGAVLGIVAPDGREGMLQRARLCRCRRPLHLRSGPGVADVLRRRPQ